MKQVVQSVAVLLTGLITFGCSDTQTSPRASQVPNYSLESGHRQSFSIEGDVVNAATGQVIHLTGASDSERIRKGYSGVVPDAVVMPFLDQMQYAYVVPE